VDVLASEPAVELIAERGGNVYVWPQRLRCCGAVARLAAASEPPRGRRFRRVDEEKRFALYVPAGPGRLPDELHLAVRRFPRRVEAFWNGCAWIV
jgi:hypothetical protein